MHLSENCAGGSRAPRPGSVRRALNHVSEEHLAHARDEWLWLDAVKECGNSYRGITRGTSSGAVRTNRTDGPHLFLAGLEFKRKG